MSKDYYCSVCGMKLTITLKGLKNKGQVLKLVDPHTCDEANLGNIQDAPEPLDPKPVYNESAPSKAELTQQMEYVDRRDPKHLRPLTSTAPFGILSSMKGAKGNDST